MKIKERTAAIVLAGGSGSRMNSDTKKQYIEIQGKPLIFYALNAFENSCIEKVIFVTAPGDEEYCRINIVKKFDFSKVIKIVPGGKERYNSVFNGLRSLKDTDYVLIHDGARPFITTDIIRRALENAIKYDACVVGMPSKDTVKIADENGFVDSTPNRSRVWNIQTPQAFNYNLVYESYCDIFNYENELEITDDAMVVEYFGKKQVKLIEGSYSNIKITTPEDLNGIENYDFGQY